MRYILKYRDSSYGMNFKCMDSRYVLILILNVVFKCMDSPYGVNFKYRDSSSGMNLNVLTVPMG